MRYGKLDLSRKVNDMKRYCLTLDLKRDPELIAEYKRYHEHIWPEVKASLHNAGILEMEIYLLQQRMFMIMEVSDAFSFDAKNNADEKNEKVQEWEHLMSNFQQTLPQTKPGEKWLLMENIFQLSKQ